jgi:hypothetical protein
MNPGKDKAAHEEHEGSTKKNHFSTYHVGWVELRNPTFNNDEPVFDVGFRSSTQPTGFGVKSSSWSSCLLRVLRELLSFFGLYELLRHP